MTGLRHRGLSERFLHQPCKVYVDLSLGYFLDRVQQVLFDPTIILRTFVTLKNG